VLVFRSVSQSCEKRVLASSCLSLRLEQLSSHCEFRDTGGLLVKTCPENSDLVKKGPKYRALYMKTCVKGKGRPTRVHEGPDRELRYSFTLSLTSALDGGGS
jgi:hypothetical protein